jgi:protein-arginine kinase activator protein McsA
MKDAVAGEHYERATELRDEIRQIEQQLKTSAPASET